MSYSKSGRLWLARAPELICTAYLFPQPEIIKSLSAHASERFLVVTHFHKACIDVAAFSSPQNYSAVVIGIDIPVAIQIPVGHLL